MYSETTRSIKVTVEPLTAPSATVLAAAWKVVSQAHAADLRVTEQVMAQGDKVNIEAKLLKPEDKLKSYDGLYTDQYLPK